MNITTASEENEQIIFSQQKRFSHHIWEK